MKSMKSLEQKEKAKRGIINLLMLTYNFPFEVAEDIVDETQSKITNAYLTESVKECNNILLDYLGLSSDYLWIFL